VASQKNTPARSKRKRATPAADGVATAQTVYAKFLERADPVAEKPAKSVRR
jgi:hypothetical protein